ncbi:MAG: molybdopterin-synthase adenylyltransferase MoeB [bacterium]|nr:molybdopterin-synthase adenylyltransferase MoeB [bacterium]MCY3653122.1 molybdopterin-synthase adenylyltransferase MoeB [bacterium]MYD04353.1 molybdopterin-synthase adenylyltransferase MoeB [Acidimicrobiia bacterium]
MAATYMDLIVEARSRIQEITAQQLATHDPSQVLLIDVREGPEWNQGKIPTARHIPRGVLEGNIHQVVSPTAENPVVLYCASGMRSALAAVTLQNMGYRSVYSLAGGFQAWKTQGGLWELPQGLPDRLQERYDRHIRLPEVGEAGQRKLLASQVLIVGAGGLGSPASLYLAAAGVGRLGLVDHDQVDVSNLQRQVIHSTRTIGNAKVESARDTIRALNPDVTVTTYDLRLTARNGPEIVEGYDLIVDGADNFPTRYLVNDLSVRYGIPVVHGSVFRFEGQVSLFDPKNGPCYRCLFPEPPAPELAPNCEEAGVLGVLPGIVGTLQAAEAIKWLVGIGENLVGRLLTLDTLTQQFRTLRFGKNPACPCCSDPSKPPPIVDYDETCTATG